MKLVVEVYAVSAYIHIHEIYIFMFLTEKEIMLLPLIFFNITKCLSWLHQYDFSSSRPVIRFSCCPFH